MPGSLDFCKGEMKRTTVNPKMQIHSEIKVED